MSIPMPGEIYAYDDSHPAKESIVLFLNFLLQVASASGMQVWATKAQLDASADHVKPGLLWADPDPVKNFPTVWVWNGSTWVAGPDRISSIKAMAEAALAIATPLDAATNVLAGDILQVINGLNFGDLQLRLGDSPVYNLAFVNQREGVVLGWRRDGDFEIMGIRIRVTESTYPVAITNPSDEMIAAIDSDGYPVGGLTPTEIEEIEGMIADIGTGSSTARPVYLDAGALYETGPEGGVLIMDPAPDDFIGAAQRVGSAVLTTSDRPFMVSTGTPVVVSKSLRMAVPNAPEYLFIVPTEGQSNSVGVFSTPLTLGQTNPYPDQILKALGLDVRLGLSADGVTDPLLDPATITDFDPLISMSGTAGASFGLTICEGVGPGIVAPIDAAMNIKPRCIFFTCGRSSAAYIFLKKTKPAYTNTLAAVTKMAALARAKGWVPIVPFILMAHAEADAASATYFADLVQWQSDFNTDLKAITGQAADIPFIMNQPSSFMGTSFQSLLAQNLAAATYPDKFVVAAPNYWMGSTYHTDFLHFTAPATYKLGKEYLAAAAMHHVFGNGWTGVRPKLGVAPTWDGTTLTVSFDIPGGPLVLDTTAVTDPGNYGFTAVDDSGALPVATVNLVNSATKVAITFTRAATTNRKLRYALTGHGGTRLLTTIPRGNLRDSTPISPNWCTHFELNF
jgi:hypothetical protein